MTFMGGGVFNQFQAIENPTHYQHLLE